MIGKTISQFHVLEKLGTGGMGTVYKARDLRLDRLVALKFISPDVAPDSPRKLRFLREARAASALDHVNICTIYEFGESDTGDLFITMAYCPGENLRARMARAPVPLGEAIHIAAQIAEGLAKAHSLGVVHRDIKPSNVMLTPEGVVKIVDFGLAKMPQEMNDTRAGAVMGTVAYMSPEQLDAEKIDHRTDIWSWGVTVYEMLAGRLPRRLGSESLNADLTLLQEPLPLAELRPDIPLELEHIVLQALRKNRQDRQQSAEEIARALRSLAIPLTAGTEKNTAASVAVLPFVNLSADAESEYFSDGLTEELIHALSRIPGLHVVSRTSAFAFKGKPQSIRTIGEALKVSTVVEGAVRTIGQKLRVNAQLVSVADGYCLWSQRFDREMKDVFEIQDEIAQKIVDMLKVKLGREESLALIKRRGNLEAYDLYLRGRFHWNKRGGEGFQRALEYFQEALTHDPDYAEVYSGIADFHIAVASWGLAVPAEAWPKAKAAAKRSLEIDDTLAEAHASMGTIRMWYEWNWKDAEREFRTAIGLNPGHPNAHIQYNLLLVQTGRFEEAEREIRAALLCDPLSVLINTYLAGLLHYRREYDRSIDQCRRALELDPNDIELHVVMALNYEQKGMYDDAIGELALASKLSGNNPLILGPLGSCYGALGQRAEAMKLISELDRLSRLGYVAPITRVMIYLALQEHGLAFEWLERAADERNVLLCYLGVGPIYDSIRDDPRYANLLRRIGLAPETESQRSTVTSPNP
jgi:eukaryotic-like serine/threonine-protein kinase